MATLSLNHPPYVLSVLRAVNQSAVSADEIGLLLSLPMGSAGFPEFFGIEALGFVFFDVFIGQESSTDGEGERSGSDSRESRVDVGGDGFLFPGHMERQWTMTESALELRSDEFMTFKWMHAQRRSGPVDE